MPMTIKLGRVLTNNEGLLPIKSYGLLIALSCDIKWQTKTIIFTVPIATKLGRMVIYFEGFLPIKLAKPWSYGLLRLRDKLNPLFLH